MHFGGIFLKYKFKIFAILICTYIYIVSINYIASSYKNMGGVSILQTNNYVGRLESKKVYLTFDDGPSNSITLKILNILKESNVKATFFVVGSQIKNRENIIKKIYSDGNGIGLHSYSHIYKKVYRSSDSFIDEMNKTAREVHNVIGINPKAIRFPAGSKKHLNKKLASRLHDLGYKIFDWNISADDGFNNNIAATKIYKNSIANKEKFTRAIITLHCSEENKETVKALPRIIKHYKDAGYVFMIINKDTHEYYFKY